MRKIKGLSKEVLYPFPPPNSHLSVPEAHFQRQHPRSRLVAWEHPPKVTSVLEPWLIWYVLFLKSFSPLMNVDECFLCLFFSENELLLWKISLSLNDLSKALCLRSCKFTYLYLLLNAHFTWFFTAYVLSCYTPVQLFVTLWL